MKPFLGGIPYALDAKRLEDAFPVTALAEGTEIKHEQLEKILDIKRGSQRYYGVVNSWIKRQKLSNGIHIVWIPGDGLRVLNPAEKLDHTDTNTERKIKGTVRAVAEYAWVDRETVGRNGAKAARSQNDGRSAVAHGPDGHAAAARRRLGTDQVLTKAKGHQ